MPSGEPRVGFCIVCNVAKLQRKKEGYYVRPSLCGQSVKGVPIDRGLAGMTLNRVEHGDGQAIMHKAIASAKSPERRCADLVRRALATVLDNSISSTDVVQSKIAEGMDYFVAQSCRYPERSAVNHRSRCCRCKGSRVADSAADLIEQR